MYRETCVLLSVTWFRVLNNLQETGTTVIELKHMTKRLEVSVLILLFCTYFEPVIILVEDIQMLICVILSCRYV